MSEKKYVLKLNVIAEPLINQWYAWSYLISPATSALVISNRFLKIMESYINNPKLHCDAIKFSALRGGAFLNTENINRVEEIKKLVFNMLKDNSQIINFSKAIEDLNKLLDKEKTNGLSLERVYENIPSIIRGYVELVYDLSNQASFRFIERLLYKSEFYNENVQAVMLSQIDNKERTFVLSTPRFPDNNAILIKKPFKDVIYDKLFEMRFKPHGYNEIVSFYEKYLNEYDKNKFLSFFEEYCLNDNFINNKIVSGVQIKYYGHACVLIEANDISILIDPLVSYGYNTEIFHYSFKDLPNKIDYVLISHGHLDHFALETLLQIRHKIKKILVPRNTPGVLQDPSLVLILQNCGFNNIIEIDELEDIDIPGGSITGVPFFGEHGDLNIHAKITYLITLNDKRLYFAVDSNNLNQDAYEKICKTLPKVDLLFIGMECSGAPMSWLYGPLFSHPISKSINQSRRLNGSNSNKAIRLIEQFKCEKVFIYAMGMEPWLSFISSISYNDDSYSIAESNKVLGYCKEIGIFAERLFGHYIIIL